MTPRRLALCTAGLTAIACVVATPARASSLLLGTRIPISTTTFALPIDITDGVDVIAWEFDLTYDPTDLQVNTTCDPFSGDIYCSLVTSYVTEGDFFASGAPFNLLNPGFVSLDLITGEQTGFLFGVNGAYGGSPPAPSGDGTLAFVEFTVIGTGNSEITVSGSATSATTVPEPGTLFLLTPCVLLLRRRASQAFKRMRQH